MKKTKCGHSWDSLPAVTNQQRNDIFWIGDSSPCQDSGSDNRQEIQNAACRFLHIKPF